MQRLRGLRLIDDDFMAAVFEERACAEFLLQIILKRDDLTVKEVHGQYSIKNLQGRSVRQVVSFEKEVIRVTNVINDTNFEIPYGEIKKLRKKKYLLIFQTKDQHIIILDKLQMSIAQQDELLRIIHKKMPWLRARGLA